MDSEDNIGKIRERPTMFNIKPAFTPKCTYSNNTLGVLLSIEPALLLKETSIRKAKIYNTKQ